MNSILTDNSPVSTESFAGFAGISASTVPVNTSARSNIQQIIRYLIFVTGIGLIFTVYLGNQITPTQLEFTPTHPIIVGESKSYPGKLRLGTFNVHSLRGRDGVSRPELVARMVSGSNCDLLFVQEVRCPWVDGNTPQTEQLADQLKLNFGENFESQFLPTEHTWFHPYFGNGLVSKIEAKIIEVTPLPNTRGKGYRQMIEIDVPMKNQTLHLLCTHLDIEQDHDLQLIILLEKFKTMPEPKILLGDLNTTKDHPLIKTTFQGTVYNAKVDWIIAQGIGTREMKVVEDAQASDHPLLTVEIFEE